MIFDNLLLHPDKIINTVLDSIERKDSLLLTYMNQHCLNTYFKNNEYKKLLNTKFTTYQADLGIYLALKFFGKKNFYRIDATGMNEMILNKLGEKKIPVSLVGGNFNHDFIREESANKGIKLAGYQNGYFQNTDAENVIKNINKFESDVIFIGMGVPMQELFAVKLSQTLKSKVIICVGNFFEFYFKTKRRAPVFIRKIGFEWIFRFLTEPQRLWKRYLIGIPLFFYQVLKLKLSGEKNIS